MKKTSQGQQTGQNRGLYSNCGARIQSALFYGRVDPSGSVADVVAIISPTFPARTDFTLPTRFPTLYALVVPPRTVDQQDRPKLRRLSRQDRLGSHQKLREGMSRVFLIHPKSVHKA